MSLASLASLINQVAQSSPNPTPSNVDLSPLIGNPLPNPSGQIDSDKFSQSPAVSSLRAQVSGSPFTTVPTPVRTNGSVGPSSINGAAVNGALKHPASPPTMTPGPQIGLMNSEASDEAPDSSQHINDLIQRMIQGTQGVYDGLQKRDADNWKAVSDLQAQMGNVKAPQLQKVQMSPLAALATALTAGAMQNRFTPQSEQFVGSLLGGLQRNNEVAYQNQSAQHQDQLAALANRIQTVRDQAESGRTFGQQELQALNDNSEKIRGILKAANNPPIQQSQITPASQKEVFERISGDPQLRDFALNLNRTAPQHRAPLYQQARQQFPEVFGTMTDAAIDKATILQPSQFQQLDEGAFASKSGLQPWQIRGLTPPERDAIVKQVQKAKKDSQTILTKAQAGGQIHPLEKADIDQRVALYEPELQARVAKAYADAYHLKHLGEIPGQNAISINQQLKRNATERQSLIDAEFNSLLNRNGGLAPKEESPEFPHFHMLLQEQDGLNNELDAYNSRLGTGTTGPQTQAGNPGATIGKEGSGGLFGINPYDQTEAGLIAQARDSLSRYSKPDQVQAIRDMLSQKIREHRGQH